MFIDLSADDKHLYPRVELGTIELIDPIAPEETFNSIPPVGGGAASEINIPTQASSIDDRILPQTGDLLTLVTATDSREEISSIIDPLTEQSLPIVRQALQEVYDLLQALAVTPDFTAKVSLAFGNSFDRHSLRAIALDFARGNFNDIPPVQILPAAAINGANGAFDSLNNSIYLSQEYIAQHAANPEAIATVLLEEIGHYLDSQINSTDAPGDEGAIWAAIAQSVDLSDLELEEIRSEDDTATVLLNGQEIEIELSSTPLNFRDYWIQVYDPQQNRNPTVSIEDSGNTLHLTGNGWKKIDFPYSITPKTILEFDFKSTVRGEIQGIGFDNDNAISQDKNFQLYGTQNWGITDFKNYSSGNWQHYRIPVGQFYTGFMNYLTFVHDHDRITNRPAESFFKNIKVYEEVNNPPPSGIPTNHWHASFINRSFGNVADYSSYNFSQPAAIEDLGPQSSNSQAIARLNQNYSFGSPARVNNDFFAMEAWTRIQLEAGKFYKLTSDSDDGTRFRFQDPQTGEIISELDGDWRVRGVADPTWAQLLNAPDSDQYDFYVQYYDHFSSSAIDVVLSETSRTGQVVDSDWVNVRNRPSSLYNSPISRFSAGETFSILQKVASPDDVNYPEWYKVITNSGRQGYVAADFVEIIEKGRVVYPYGMNLRENPSQYSQDIGDLDPNETFTIIQQVDSFGDWQNPDWYEIITKDGTQGYVAASSGFVEVIGGSDVITIGDENLFDLDEIFSVVLDSMLPYAEESIPLILSEAQASGITDPRQIAYILATTEHESRLGQWMEELSSGWQYEGRVDLGNIYPGDGPRYKGRGYVQITGRNNYTDWSDRLGIDLVNFPQRASEPEIAATILVQGMRDGTFTGLALNDFINGQEQDFYSARRIVNGLDRASDISQIADIYLTALT